MHEKGIMFYYLKTFIGKTALGHAALAKRGLEQASDSYFAY